jgi:hypothetical protein
MAFRGDNLLMGADVTRALWEMGSWLEAAVVAAGDEGGRIGDADRIAYGRLAAGLDYSFKNATYAFLEYHYSSAGRNDPAGYARESTSRAYTDGGVYLLGRHYLAAGATWPVTLIFNVGGTVLANLGDGSFLLAPVVEYNVLENAYLAAGAFAGFGDGPALAGDAPPSPAALDGSIDFQSEFGTYADVYYLSLRYYY